MTRPGPDPRGLTALLLGAVCIGFAPIWVRWSEVGPVATAFHRLLLALPVLAFWAERDRTNASPSLSRADRLWILATGVFFALDLGLWHISIRFTSVANSTLLANLAPLFVALGARIFLNERASRRFVSSLSLTLVGATLLTGASVASEPTRLPGDLFAIATALFYGCYQLGVARLRRSHAPGRILFLSSLTSLPVLGGFAWALDEPMLPITPVGWLVLGGLALTGQILGQGLITYGFAHLPAGFSSLTLLLQPLVAALAAWCFFGESLSVLQIAGGFLLLVGIAFARPHAPPQSSASTGNSAGARPPGR